MSEHDIRWIQRFNHYLKALAKLEEAVGLAHQRPLSELEGQGMIQAFEFTHELAWNTMKDFLGSRGVRNLFGSKDTTREAFKRALIQNGDAWMEMIRDRNLTSHTYNEETAVKIVSAIIDTYFNEFMLFKDRANELKREEQS